MDLKFIKQYNFLNRITSTVGLLQINCSVILSRLQSIAAHRDNFVKCLSVYWVVTLSLVTQGYFSQTHAFLGMQPFWCTCSKYCKAKAFSFIVTIRQKEFYFQFQTEMYLLFQWDSVVYSIRFCLWSDLHTFNISSGPWQKSKRWVTVLSFCISNTLFRLSFHKSVQS